MTTAKPRIEVGWREWVALPELGIRAIEAKVDTGARSSALRVFRLETYRTEGRPMARFSVYPHRQSTADARRCEARITGHRIVSDSSGDRERRWVVRTRVRLGLRSWPINVTLSRRGGTTFRMLLGRSAMRRRLVVVPDRSYVLGRPRRIRGERA